MAKLEPTDDVVTLKELHEEVFGEEPEDNDGYPSGVVAVCDGEWRREPDGRWRHWADTDYQDPDALRWRGFEMT